MKMETLTIEDLFLVNGGGTTSDYNDGYKSGHAAGVYIKQVLDGVGILSVLKSLLF
jgi:hypothetical protein